MSSLGMNKKKGKYWINCFMDRNTLPSYNRIYILIISQMKTIRQREHTHTNPFNALEWFFISSLSQIDLGTGVGFPVPQKIFCFSRYSCNISCQFVFFCQWFAPIHPKSSIRYCKWKCEEKENKMNKQTSKQKSNHRMESTSQFYHTISAYA